MSVIAKTSLTVESANTDWKFFTKRNRKRLETNFHEIVQASHTQSVARGWWHDKKGQRPLKRNCGELLALIHSEVSEALEGVRKGKLDDHLKHRPAEEVELADALVRIFDYAEARGLDVVGAYFEKLRYNMQRPDHDPNNRAKRGGKKF